VDEGDSSDVPKVFFSQNNQGSDINGGDQPKEGDDLFEEALEDALCVFKSGGANTDLLKENNAQILFYVDLENEEIIDKAQFEENKQDEDGEQGIGEKPHPMLFN